MAKLVIFIFTTFLLFGRFDVVAVESCGAFNNLKHTKNGGDVVLKVGKRYTAFREHKGQYLIRMEGANPLQRWVDRECFSTKTTPLPSRDVRDVNIKKGEEHRGRDKSSKMYEDRDLVSLLVLSWQNSFCETHRNRKECRLINSSNRPSRLTLHGLWPQPRSNQYCGVDPKIVAKDKNRQWRAIPKPKLSSESEELMRVYLPGYLSGLDRHEWIKHGTCYSKDSERYFHDALSLTKEVDSSIVGEYLRANEGKRVKLINLKRVFDKAFGKGASVHLEMSCRNRLLSELRIHIRGRGDSLKKLLEDAPTGRSRCTTAIVDAKGYQ